MPPKPLPDRVWDYAAPNHNILAGHATRLLPPQVRLTDEDVQRIAVAKGLNSIPRAYVMGLLAGMRREK